MDGQLTFRLASAEGAALVYEPNIASTPKIGWAKGNERCNAV